MECYDATRKNISEGGPLEAEFIIYGTFYYKKIDVYGNASDELKEF